MQQSGSGKIIALSILAGLISGIILLGLNFTILGPYYELFSSATLDELIASGEYDEEEFDLYAQNQNTILIMYPILIGLAVGAVFGLVYIYTKGYLVRFCALKRAMLIAGVTWFVLFVIPVLKYPVQPIAISGDIGSPIPYHLLFLSYLAISAISALVVSIGFSKIRKENKIFGAAAIYLAVVAAAFMLFPQSPDSSSVPQNIMIGFRSLTSAIMTAFWFILGAIAGIFWKKYVPLESDVKPEN